MKEESLLRRIAKHKWNYIFISPMLILYIMFTLRPIANIFQYSFFRWDGYGPLDQFIGLKNYVELFSDSYYWNAFTNALTFAASHLVVEVMVALVLAFVLNNLTSKMKNVYRLLIFIPVITTTSVVGMVFTALLHPMDGVVNEVLRAIGLIERPINFLGSVKLSLPSVIFVSIWKRIGISLVYWLAALQTIPTDLYEAASIDGASKFKQFVHITIPMIAPIGVVIALFAFKNGLYPFDLVKTMTNAGPVFSTDVVGSYIYRYAFDSEFSVTRYGFASAGGTFFALSIIFITALPTLITRKIKSKKIKGGR